jgi:hypothetical protein
MNPTPLSCDASTNPFPASDRDRHEIWEMLMTRDFEAFASCNWAIVEGDFWRDGFCGVHAQKHADPSCWVLAFPNVVSYRDEWLRQATEFAPVKFDGMTALEFLFRSCRLDEIDVVGNRAIGKKKFDGSARITGGEIFTIRFQTLYQLIRHHNQWQIAGFVGYLPNPMPTYDPTPNATTP